MRRPKNEWSEDEDAVVEIDGIVSKVAVSGAISATSSCCVAACLPPLAPTFVSSGALLPSDEERYRCVPTVQHSKEGLLLHPGAERRTRAAGRLLANLVIVMVYVWDVRALDFVYLWVIPV